MLNRRYIEPLGVSLAPLGFGVMRLPMEAGAFPPAVYRLISAAVEYGINYFDTAYLYLGGRSEELIREALVANYPRGAFCIADKLPVWECADEGDMERIFQIQLDRLGVEYIDFYLLHALHRSRWFDVRDKGVLDFLERKRREGRVRRVGFSLHDTADTLALILDAYTWDFAQLQINYYDWTVQHARESYDCLAARGLPCMVMEPVGGGRLAKLPDEAEALLKAARPEDSIPAWAIRFAAGLPNVAVTLSGMSDLAQLRDNVSCFHPFLPLNEEETAALNGAAELLRARNTIPCTACRYCVDACVRSVDIPKIFQCYNDSILFHHAASFDNYFLFVQEGQRADACIRCGKCVAQCPQGIDIPGWLARLHHKAAGHFLGLDVERLQERFGGERDTHLVCFGAGAVGKTARALLADGGVRVDFFCDNARHLWGEEVDGIPVISPARLAELYRESKVEVLITSSAYRNEISEQLKTLGIETVLPSEGAVEP